MAELRVRVIGDDGPMWDVHGHPLPRGIEVFVYYRDGTIGRGVTRWNELPLFGCICPYDDTDPACPLPIASEGYGD